MRVLRLSRPALLAGAALVGLLLIALAGAGLGRDTARPTKSQSHISRVASLRVPYFTPKRLTSRLAAVRAFAGQPATRGGGGDRARGVFNRDDFGLPQNEESVTTCATNRDVLLSGTNDYRGLIDEQGNFTGWHFSNDGGRSLTNEGLLPTAPTISDPSRELPSGGDPVMVAGEGCTLFGGGLAYNPVDPFGDVNGVQVAKSDPATLASCETTFPNSANPACWPVNRLVAEAEPPHFLDKPWYDVGVSGAAGEVVWVVYSDFLNDESAPLGFTGAEIFAVRCDSDLVSCTSPIPISVDDGDVQFGDVTIAPDGRVYVTWAQIIGELPDDPEFPEQRFVIKMRVAPPGSLAFGPEQIVHNETKPIPFEGFLHANDFRIATYPKNEVVTVGDGQRTFVVWDACGFRPLPFVCEEAEIRLKYSDNDGASWSDVHVISGGGDNYFPTLAWNQNTERSRLVFAWFTNRYDDLFHNAQDVEYMVMDPAHPSAGRANRLTRPSNESEADPLLGGFFIGDYIEVAALDGEAWVAYNANYLHKTLLGPFGVEGIPVPQQDNYLVRVGLGRR